MVIKPEAEDVVCAFEDWVNKMVWMLGKDIYIGEQEYLDWEKTALMEKSSGNGGIYE